MTKIEIDYPEYRIAANKERWAAFEKMRYLDRVPVLAWVGPRYFLDVRGVSYTEYFANPRDQVYHQLMNSKWRAENIPDDSFADASGTVSPDFENTGPAAFGAEIAWYDDKPPRVVPFIKTVDEMESLQPPSPQDGIWGKRLRWYEEMCDVVKDYRLVINGEDVPINVTVGGMDAAFTAAIDLVGSEFYLWILEYPQACKRFLAKINHAYIDWENYCRSKTGAAMSDASMVADAAELLSPDQFREFCLPYLMEMYDAFPGRRRLHMCGQTSHILDVLAEEARITHFDGFGSCVPLDDVARRMAGRVRIIGNVDPVLMLTGTPAQIEAVSRRVLQVLAPYGGLMLCDGCNIAPGTPVENIQAMQTASEAYGLPKLIEEGNAVGWK
ncbi:MAG: uroporphyrinogen decarboxylase family protein [Armatimonadetes bacterium]|nr:uroporphyrinogen decarboxylase family protein [Armatimonadota bacterium]